jgi:hypothetical protein
LCAGCGWFGYDLPALICQERQLDLAMASALGAGTGEGAAPTTAEARVAGAHIVATGGGSSSHLRGARGQLCVREATIDRILSRHLFSY